MEGKWRFEKVLALKPGQTVLFGDGPWRLTQVVVGETKVALFGVECSPLLTPLAVATGRGQAERLIVIHDRNDVEFSRQEMLVADPDPGRGMPFDAITVAAPEGE